MTELKSAERFIEIFNELQWKNATERDKHLSDFIASIQRNAIEAALEIAADKAKTVYDFTDGRTEIDKLSITSLINHEKLKV